jgi:non-specific serine/threonine protein kinase
VQKFQEQERSKLFFISLKAGGVDSILPKLLMFCFGSVVESLCRKARYWPCTSYWTVEQSKCSIHNQKHRGGKNHSVTENKTSFGCTADENHISPEIEENLDFILA